jgi:hypothetical protein
LARDLARIGDEAIADEDEEKLHTHEATTEEGRAARAAVDTIGPCPKKQEPLSLSSAALTKI